MRKSALVFLLFFVGVVHAGEGRDLFTVGVSGPSRIFSAGLRVSLTVRGQFVGDKPIQLLGSPSVRLRLDARNPDGEHMRWTCEPREGYVDYGSHGPRTIQPGSQWEKVIPFCPQEAGAYVVRGWLETTIENSDRIDVFSDSLTITIAEPTGVDAEAYTAFDGDPLSIYSRRGRQWSELLQRFPTSTYAAYVIWSNFVRGTSSDKNSVDVLLGDLSTSIESQSNSVPCDIPRWCDDNGWMSMQGEIFVRWRTGWFDRVLKYHPDIWFADEVRLKLALDSYLLGDKASCAAGLEALADHAKPYVAEKARALLEAMQSKNMLPGGPKNLTEAPASAAPEGKTTR